MRKDEWMMGIMCWGQLIQKGVVPPATYTKRNGPFVGLTVIFFPDLNDVTSYHPHMLLYFSLYYYYYYYFLFSFFLKFYYDFPDDLATFMEFWSK